MPSSKAKVIEKLSEVKNLGESYATSAYEDLGVRSLDDLIAAAKDNKLQTIKGIGAAKEKKILASAVDLNGADEPAPPKAKKSKPKKSKSTKAKSTKTKSKKASSKADDKKAEPKKEAKAKEAPKSEAKPSASKPKPNGSTRTERQRTTYRPPSEPKRRPSIPGLLFKLGKKIIGRILG